MRRLGNSSKPIQTPPHRDAYYAAFHALTAIFALDGQTFVKHSAIRAALHRDLIQTGKLDSDMGLTYDFLMDLRETGDYGGLAQVTAESARSAVEKAKSFVEALSSAYSEVDDSE